MIYLALNEYHVLSILSNGGIQEQVLIHSHQYITYTVRPATALFLVPGIYSAIENSGNGGSCYLVSCKFLQKIVL